MAQFTYNSWNEGDTDQLGTRIASVAQPGDILALAGTLGAGKTRLVQGIAVALGNAAESITSPTFVLLNEYRSGRLPIFHFDVYRLKDDDEFLELGAEEYFDSAGLCLIEWGDRIEHLLPERASRLTINMEDDGSRQIKITGPLGDRLSADATG